MEEDLLEPGKFHQKQTIFLNTESNQNLSSAKFEVKKALSCLDASGSSTVSVRNGMGDIIRKSYDSMLKDGIYNKEQSLHSSILCENSNHCIQSGLKDTGNETLDSQCMLQMNAIDIIESEICETEKRVRLSHDQNDFEKQEDNFEYHNSTSKSKFWPSNELSETKTELICSTVIVPSCLKSLQNCEMNFFPEFKRSLSDKHKKCILSSLIASSSQTSIPCKRNIDESNLVNKSVADVYSQFSGSSLCNSSDGICAMAQDYSNTDNQLKDSYLSMKKKVCCLDTSDLVKQSNTFKLEKMPEINCDNSSGLKNNTDESNSSVTLCGFYNNVEYNVINKYAEEIICKDVEKAENIAQNTKKSASYIKNVSSEIRNDNFNELEISRKHEERLETVSAETEPLLKGCLEISSVQLHTKSQELEPAIIQWVNEHQQIFDQRKLKSNLWQLQKQNLNESQKDSQSTTGAESVEIKIEANQPLFATSSMFPDLLNKPNHINVPITVSIENAGDLAIAGKDEHQGNGPRVKYVSRRAAVALRLPRATFSDTSDDKDCFTLSALPPKEKERLLRTVPINEKMFEMGKETFPEP